MKDECAECENVQRMKSNRKTGIASGEPSMSQCGRVIGEEERSAVHGQENGSGRGGGDYREVLSSYGVVIESNKSVLL